MDPFLKMDIFFFVSTACVVVLTALVALMIFKLWKILGHIERIAEIAGKEAENIREDAAYMRGKLMGVLDAMFAFLPRRRKTKQAASSEDGGHVN